MKARRCPSAGTSKATCDSSGPFDDKFGRRWCHCFFFFMIYVVAAAASRRQKTFTELKSDSRKALIVTSLLDLMTSDVYIFFYVHWLELERYSNRRQTVKHQHCRVTAQ